VKNKKHAYKHKSKREKKKKKHDLSRCHRKYPNKTTYLEPLRNERKLKACLVSLKNPKIFKILLHIKSFDAYIEH
jgi:hypothetical protein